ncbi:MAG: 30S ribosomal protein S2 [Patescibacteria group bacterium]
MQDISLQDMLKAGVHFGHQQKYRHPKMRPYIHTNRGGLYIVDLEQTAIKLREACEFLSHLASQGGRVLFVGTKRQARSIVKEAAVAAGMPYVIERWIGGTLTNFDNIGKLGRRLKDLRVKLDQGQLDQYTKRERLQFSEEAADLEVVVGGIQDLTALPQALFVVDIKKEKTAVREAISKKIPVVAIADTNVNPELVTYPIPANDDATKSIRMITGIVAAAIAEGKQQAAATVAAKAAAPSPVPVANQ